MKVEPPPYTVSPRITTALADIGERLGQWASTPTSVEPKLRRGSHARSVHASLAIEGNTLTLDQVTRVIGGTKVVGQAREVHEVRNAFAAYEQLSTWRPEREKDLLAAHGVMMRGLVDDPGQFRRGAVGIQHGPKTVHVAPPADRVPGQVRGLLKWVGTTDEHPLIVSAVCHYELEFIHPFSDGNGRLGRLWQTLILSRWKPVFSSVPTETVIRDRQAGYYSALAASDRAGSATPFVEFSLDAIRSALDERLLTDQDTDQESDQVGLVVRALAKGSKSARELMDAIGLRHLPTFRANYLRPALDAGLIEMSNPDRPTSRAQRYKLAKQGRGNETVGRG